MLWYRNKTFIYEFLGQTSNLITVACGGGQRSAVWPEGAAPHTR